MAKFDIENFPTSESALKQLGYVSKNFYDNSYVGKWLFQVIGTEFDDVKEILDEFPDQFFVSTATWGLMYHELKWGLQIRENLSYEERRKLIYQKMNQRNSITPYRMELYLQNATGLTVQVCDCHDVGDYGFEPEHPNTFAVYISGEGSVDFDTVFTLLNKLKQSHTTYQVYSISDIECTVNVCYPMSCYTKSPIIYERTSTSNEATASTYTTSTVSGYAKVAVVDGGARYADSIDCSCYIGFVFAAVERPQPVYM